MIAVVVWMYLYYSQRNKGNGETKGRGKLNMRSTKKPDKSKDSRSGSTRSERHKK